MIWLLVLSHSLNIHSGEGTDFFGDDDVHTRFVLKLRTTGSLWLSRVYEFSLALKSVRETARVRSKLDIF